MTTSYEDLVRWTLGIRRASRSARLASLLTRAVTPELAGRSLTDPTVARMLEPIAASRRAHALAALGVIATHCHLRHSPHVPLGRALSVLRSGSTATALATATSLPAAPALRILGNALGQAAVSGPADLVEFLALAAEWDDRTAQERSRFLVDFHAAHRA